MSDKGAVKGESVSRSEVWELLFYVAAVVALVVGAFTGSSGGQLMGFFVAMSLCLVAVGFVASRAKKAGAAVDPEQK